MLKQLFYNQPKTTQRLTALLVILIIASIGTYLLVASHAATPYAANDASGGTLGGSAKSIQNCSGSNAGDCVAFGQPIPMDGAVALALSSPGAPFAASSFWNTPVPDNVALNPNSAAYATDITNQVCYGTAAPGSTCNLNSPPHVGLNSSNWSAPLYVVPAGQPPVQVQSDGCTNQPNLVSLVVNRAGLPPGVPIPANAHGSGETNTPDADTDQEIQVYQPSSDQEWEFWKFQKASNGTWEACVGGVITGVSTSAGIFPPGSGSTASGLPLLGGVVRIEELQAGEIDHVMNLSIMDGLSRATVPANITTTPGSVTLNNDPGKVGYSWPANRTDGGDTDNLAIPEGQRFILNPALNLSTLKLSPVAMTIAVAAQKYGFVVDDHAGTVNVRLGDPTAYTAAGLPNPYSSGPGVGGAGTGGLFAGATSSQAVMQNFPWNQLEALPFNYGEPSP